MKTVYRAFFVERGNSLVTLVSNRVEKYGLSQTDQAELRSNKVWTAKITDCVNVVDAPDAKRLVATDTSGRHFGLCSETGEILWKTSKIGEGDSGIIVRRRMKALQSLDVFIFGTWSGRLQYIDPVNGQEIAKPVAFPYKLRDLQKVSSTQNIFVTSIVPAKSDYDPVGLELNSLDLENNTLRQVFPTTFNNRIMVSPFGEKALFTYISEGTSGLKSDRSDRWVIKDLQTGSTIAERTFEPNVFLSYEAVWSPDGRFIATANEAGHLLISADTLETLTVLEGKQARRPAFHPSGNHLCLCRERNTKIEQIGKFCPL